MGMAKKRRKPYTGVELMDHGSRTGDVGLLALLIVAGGLEILEELEAESLMVPAPSVVERARRLVEAVGAPVALVPSRPPVRAGA